jgi:hypothetical protein
LATRTAPLFIAATRDGELAPFVHSNERRLW